ncbi:hypothetical protein [Flavobacterium sp. 7A]|uniref:hypothetical protein n=1 Tax=Flavobacterium sp. 7A TaxID=2940571 RepID=UPI002227E1A2|nr:hypothetical protein [Flavobacterium sp. 7A]MCW2120238.1 hypothetical protein [Flavobacterium sp. 7A]
MKILTIIFWTFLISSKSLACDCKIPNSLKEIQNREFTESKYIFIGEILKINSKKNTFEIKVIESFKGVLNGKIYRGINNQWCGPVIDKSGKWLIYANRKSDNLIQIRTCGLTRSFKNPEKNIPSTRVPDLPPVKQSKSQNMKIQTNWKLKDKSDLENEIAELRKINK